MFTVELKGDRALIQRLSSLPMSVRAALEAKVTMLAISLQAHIVRDKLNGQVLNQKSGALARSIQEEAPITSGLKVEGRVFSAGDVKYAAIHEFGGVIPAHDIVPNKAEALAFMLNGQQAFAKIVHMPDVQMPERSFMRSALADMKTQIVQGLMAAVKQGAAKT